MPNASMNPCIWSTELLMKSSSCFKTRFSELYRLVCEFMSAVGMEGLPSPFLLSTQTPA